VLQNTLALDWVARLEEFEPTLKEMLVQPLPQPFFSFWATVEESI
jgi:hypothetical protein